MDVAKCGAGREHQEADGQAHTGLLDRIDPAGGRLPLPCPAGKPRNFRVNLRMMVGALTFAATAIVPARASSLTVSVTGFKHARGQAVVIVYVSQGDFLKKARYTATSAIDPKTLTARVTFSGVDEPAVAVVAYHDENGNNVLDRNFIGMPKEPFGFSNHLRPHFGPPAFDDAKVMLHKDENRIPITVAMAYF